MATAEYFYRDLDRTNQELKKLGAVVTCEDGFTYIDESKAPAALVSAYRRLTQFGYANGLI